MIYLLAEIVAAVILLVAWMLSMLGALVVWSIESIAGAALRAFRRRA